MHSLRADGSRVTCRLDWGADTIFPASLYRNVQMDSIADVKAEMGGRKERKVRENETGKNTNNINGAAK